MRVKLAENIRALRKQRGLTQEQLAEATGVTVGAVHKWETGLSTPELSLIVELADYFGISVDALLGYEMKDNRLETTLERLNRCLDEEDPEGVKEAEKALRRFPNSFDVVYRSALMLMITGGKNHDDSQLARAYGMFEQALLLTSADAGIAMGGIGSDIAVESADAVLVSDELKRLPYLFSLMQKVMKKVHVNIIASLFINLTAVVLSALGVLSPVTGALWHNCGSVFVVVNAALLLRLKDE